ncbi:ADP-ribosylglycohydrolase family protein [Calidithermus chliarophilus]|uniref:ADP-ribosylglycohydrolase family protein n=1 Tax=Calidithermus chliarophilus TaxID=52023 RepID=UPI0003F52C76|nr:ADP-ribosylglycohydrolase family protein [Calidithermus chliarophilus]
MASSIWDGARGCIYGGAVGDAMGGSTEGYSPQAIQERFGGYVTDFVGPFNPDWQTARPHAPFHKGDGHITDDTHMVLALANVYAEVRDHLDAYHIAELFVREIADKVVYIPELERETVLQNRLFHAEKYLVLRLRHAHADPREAGVGNVVNCGAAMYMAPVGIVNAGDPAGAYREALEIAGAHQSSYGREAAAVMAAAVAAALRPRATAASVVEAVLELAKDGTRQAIEAATAAARGCRGWQQAIPVLREAVRPFDTVGENYREPGLDARRPSRTKAIEELPVALGMLVATGGDYVQTVYGGVNYGRDSDSIASMGGAIAGALGGEAAVPRAWVERVAGASRKDFRAAADALAKVALEVLEKDRRRFEERTANFPQGVGA